MAPPLSGTLRRGDASAASFRGEAAAVNVNNNCVDGAELALQHDLGLGGAAVVTMYRRSPPA